MEDNFKQLIIARKDIQMSPGKLAAQVSHASIAFLTNILRNNMVGEVLNGYGEDFMKPKNVYRIGAFDIDKDLYDKWINGAFTKVVCQANNKNQLLKAVTIAEEMGLKEGKDYFLIKDNCLTELEPEEIVDGIGRTLTCIGFKPMCTEDVHKISKKFHLYV